MSDPEISRRCSACGVSVRHYALFCPQCGQPIDNQAGVPQGEVDASRTIAESADRDTRIEPAPPILDAFQTEPPRPNPPIAEPFEADVQQTSQGAPTQALNPPQHSPVGRPGVADNVRGRVAQIRQVSSVVIDQAAYDPSLRFLLVAAALFLLFLLLMILSKVIG